MMMEPLCTFEMSVYFETTASIILQSNAHISPPLWCRQYALLKQYPTLTPYGGISQKVLNFKHSHILSTMSRKTAGLCLLTGAMASTTCCVMCIYRDRRWHRISILHRHVCHCFGCKVYHQNLTSQDDGQDQAATKIIGRFLWLQIPMWRQDCLYMKQWSETRFLVSISMLNTQSISVSTDIDLIHWFTRKPNAYTGSNCNVTHQMVRQRTLSEIYKWI